jgi:hypothetical protein
MMLRTAVGGSLVVGSIGLAVGILLTQAPGRDHKLDLMFLAGSAVLLAIACWLLPRITKSGILRDALLTVAVLELLVSAYGVVSSVTYSR